MWTFIKVLNENVKKIIILSVSYMFDLPLPCRFPGCTYKQFNNTPGILKRQYVHIHTDQLSIYRLSYHKDLAMTHLLTEYPCLAETQRLWKKLAMSHRILTHGPSDLGVAKHLVIKDNSWLRLPFRLRNLRYGFLYISIICQTTM